MKNIVRKFDITIQTTDSDNKLSLRGVDYDYFLKAYSNYADKLDNNIKEGNYTKSTRGVKKANYNPYNNLNNI
jgi:hypothetical protein